MPAETDTRTFPCSASVQLPLGIDQMQARCRNDTEDCSHQIQQKLQSVDFRSTSPDCSQHSPEQIQSSSHSLLVIHHGDEKPRAFKNLIHEIGGGGSCWINAAAQALLSPLAFKEVLANLWHAMPGDVREQLRRINRTPRRHGVQIESPSPLLAHEGRLAATFFMAHTLPRTDPFYPYLLADVFYKGRQDDAAEFVARVLHPSQSPSLQNAVCGRMNCLLTCDNPVCKHSRPTEGENFTSLQLPLLSADGGYVQSVQEAVDMYMPDEIVELSEGCECCNASVKFKKAHVVARFPVVLVVTLNRWTGHEIHQAVLHPIEASQQLRFKEKSYGLCSAVCHLGKTPHSGHYIAVTRHPTNHGEWWLYDDHRRVIATDSQVATTCSYRKQPMKCYVLIYEQLGDAADTQTQQGDLERRGDAVEEAELPPICIKYST